jgi:hypothetical protein
MSLSFPNGANPATTVYIAEETSLRKSSDGSANFDPKPVRTFDAYIFSVICPDANRVWVGTGDGQVHFSPDGGSSWQDFSPGGTGPVTSVAADPGGLDTVAAAYGGFSRINSRVRTKHCFLSKDSGANWADISGTDDTITGNLPDLPLHSVVFDDSTVPPTIIVGADTSVLRSENNGLSWERLGTALPRVTCRSLALDQLDTTRSPRLLRIGTYGRSCFELTRASGPSLAVEANFAFGAVVKGQSATLPLQLLNVGDAPVNITSFARSAGDADFDFASAPNLLALNPGEVRPFGITFTAGGNDKDIRTATFTPAKPRRADGANLRERSDLRCRRQGASYLRERLPQFWANSQGRSPVAVIHDREYRPQRSSDRRVFADRQQRFFYVNSRVAASLARWRPAVVRHDLFTGHLGWLFAGQAATLQQ